MGRSQLLYKLQIRADLKDTLNCAAIVEYIIWPHLGRQFHLPSKFTILFARILRQIIGWRNRMAWETKSLSLLIIACEAQTHFRSSLLSTGNASALRRLVSLPITTCFGSNEKRAKRVWSEHGRDLDWYNYHCRSYHDSDLTLRCIDIVSGL